MATSEGKLLEPYVLDLKLLKCQVGQQVPGTDGREREPVPYVIYIYYVYIFALMWPLVAFKEVLAHGELRILE